jgi:predicted MFS family arabinose efflux permease
MIKVFYYYYYLFYTKVLPDNQPHVTVIFTLSFSLALLINGLLNILLAYTINYALGSYEMIGIFVMVLGINYLLFYRKGKAKKIIQEQPKFFRNHKISIILTILFFLITASFLFWEAGYVGNILGSR